MKKILTKDIALQYAIDYCKKKEYNYKILDKLSYDGDKYLAFFVKDKKLDFKPDLTTDIASLPYCFLIVESDGTVSECRDTHLFLEGKIEL